MTREEAIEIFKRLKENAPNEMHLETVGSAQELFSMAISALEQESTDTVSRGAFEQVMWERDVAIGQLKELGYELGEKIEPCDDAISRQAVLDGLASIAKAKAKSDAQKALMGRVMFFTEQLPPVTPQQKYGKWIGHREHCEDLGVIPSGLGAYEWCSNCDCGIDVREWHRNHYNYCPNCGCCMVEPQESEEQTE